MPERIQRRRVAGWRKPPGAIYVGRGSRWGNPFTVQRMADGTCAVVVIQSPSEEFRAWMLGLRKCRRQPGEFFIENTRPEGSVLDTPTVEALDDCYRRAMHRSVEWFSAYLNTAPDLVAAARSELRGHDLMCWCPLTYPDGRRYPCHADVWLEVANMTNGESVEEANDANADH